MKTIKICLMYNHFQLQDGVSRSAIAIANKLAVREDVEVTLIPIFKYHKDCFAFLDKRVRVKPIFRFYFRGFTKIVKFIPAKFLYKCFINDEYDVNVAFQHGHSMRIMASGANKNHKSIAWLHIYDEGLNYIDSYRKMDKLVCVSQCNARRLSVDIEDIVPVDFCYNPIDEESIKAQGCLPVKLKRKYDLLFVSMGRMSKEKGFQRLLNCVKRLKDDGYKFSLWLIGDGDLLESLKQQSINFAIDDMVTFVGQQTNPHAYTAKADVFVCSSFLEGYSTACTEAIMLNVPVITTNVSGAEEIIEEAGCGEVFDSTEDAIYLAMKRILDNPALVQTWKNKLAETKVNFYAEKRFQRFLEIVGLQ